MREKILSLLETNSRIDLADLAAMLGLTEAEVANEIALMEKENIICGYHTMINWDNTSSEKVSALIEVSVTPHRGLGFDKMAERIYQYDEVSSVYLMSGTFDFTVLIEGRTMKDIAYFVSDKLSPMDGIVRCATHFVLKKYKDHGTILVDTKSDERMLVSP
ncbi:MAG: Lrp/AsnC family transcriptional regulator [Lachnospiraceae bacterium]|jgi:DNA-binding Lrp family transcriptional regulator|nr:Lrp/AsnC family transcriptional regulator [Lachnospiraceae bacterium]